VNRHVQRKNFEKAKGRLEAVTGQKKDGAGQDHKDAEEDLSLNGRSLFWQQNQLHIRLKLMFSGGMDHDLQPFNMSLHPVRIGLKARIDHEVEICMSDDFFVRPFFERVRHCDHPASARDGRIP